MQGMIIRLLSPILQKALLRVPAVALLGPRQVGKTTLAKNIGLSQSSVYLDLESPEDILKLTDPLAYLSSHNDKLIIIDEIQRAPDLFTVLRGLIDKGRQAGRKGGHFLLLGSASMDLLRQSSESLAGRILYLEMGGLNLLEIFGESSSDLSKLWLRGGFPESFLADTDSHSMEWLRMLIRTYLERDIPQMGFRIPAERLRRLWTMLAHLQGECINLSKIAGNLEIDGKTVANYIDVLVDLLLVRRLQPWHENVKKRMVKSPRLYIRDSGILHQLLGIQGYEALLSNPVIGKSFEGFVIENIFSVLPGAAEVYYYRTAAGAEIDLVLKHANQEIWAVEIKHGLAPKVKAGFHQGAEDIQATHKFVIYSGQDEFGIGQGTTVVSLVGFMNKLVQHK